MVLSKFIEGLQILQPYYDKDAYSIGAEHDVFYAYATDKPLPLDKVQRLIDLGWFQEIDTGDDDFAVSHYDPTEGWSAFT